ncbi:MAG: hypothetical protein ABS84_14350 [Rubrivivax sp. SCN 71-131]|jgi:hypothetical protein|nr:MAG: hypothetical protein ABS84_14350 [Rubrivivax sp. SCN 71-131]
MSESSVPLRLLSLWRRRAGDPAPSEPADVGTAFGLELSMLPDEVDAAHPTARAQGPWWQRLMHRPAG